MASYEYKRYNRILARDPDDMADPRPLTMYVAKHGSKASYISGIASFTINGAKGTELRDLAFMYKNEDLGPATMT